MFEDILENFREIARNKTMAKQILVMIKGLATAFLVKKILVTY